MRSARTFRANRASEPQAPDASRQRTGYHRLDPSRCLRVPPENLEDTLPKAGQEETVLLCEIDLAKVGVTRTHWPFLRDRRIDAYGYLTCRLIDE